MTSWHDVMTSCGIVAWRTDITWRHRMTSKGQPPVGCGRYSNTLVFFFQYQTTGPIILQCSCQQILGPHRFPPEGNCIPIPSENLNVFWLWGKNWIVFLFRDKIVFYQECKNVLVIFLPPMRGLCNLPMGWRGAM